MVFTAGRRIIRCASCSEKQCVLAVQYGIEAEGLAGRVEAAHDLLRMYRETFATFWK